MKKPLTNRIGIELLTVIVLGLLLAFIYGLGGFRHYENILSDTISTWSWVVREKDASNNIVYAMTSQRCLNEGEKYYNMGWPWKRESYAKITNYLYNSGAKVIVYDSIYTERSRYTYTWEKNKQFGNILKKVTNNVQNPITIKKLKSLTKIYTNKYMGKNDDNTFAKAMANTNNVILGVMFNTTTDNIMTDVQRKVNEFDKKYSTKKLRTVLSKQNKNVDLQTKSRNDLIQIVKQIFLKNFENLYKKKNSPLIQRFALPVDKVYDNNVIPSYYNVSPPINLYAKSSKDIGSVEAPIDLDGKIRRIPLILSFYNKYYPSLSFSSIYNYYNGKKKITIGTNYIKLGNQKISLTDKGYLRLKYYGTRHIYKNYYHIDIMRIYDHINQIYSIYSNLNINNPISKKLLFKNSKYIKQVRKKVKKVNPDIVKNLPDKIISLAPPQAFNNKIVIIGATAAGMLDIRSTPFSPIEAGAHIHGTAIDNILQNDILTEIRENLLLIIIIFILPILTYFLIKDLAVIWGAIITIMLIGGIFIASAMIFKYANIVIDSLTLMLSILITYPIITGINYFKENKQKKYIQGAFGHYLSPKVIEIIINDPNKMALGGEERDITAFFSDVEKFSTISESLNPTELVTLLNEYLTVMCDIISKYDGVIDKFEGDALIAFWGAPLEQLEHAKLACFTAIEMQEKMIELRKLWATREQPQLSMRIGVNSGLAVIGNMGSKQRVDYTMLGDTVNLASRLEGANKFYHSYTMISESTYLKTKDSIDVRELDKIKVVGKNESVVIYELLAKKNETKKYLADAIELYLKGLQLYKKRNFKEAMKTFEAVLKLIPYDGPSDNYIKRCNYYILNPPPKDWDGVYTLTSKG